ncbi:MAG: FAD-dependent monooxygenase [Caldilineaceae bacterium]|jgi:flavin-dependent dehydrogenase|nr:FAD-dependent monooxygenase [Caldilineaceae bacterium]
MMQRFAPAPTHQYDVAVIGAGPAGGCAAATLAAAGWRVALIERTALPRHRVCGEFLSPEAQATLRHLGLQDELAALKPRALTAATLTSRRGATLEMALPGVAWGLSRFALDAALAQAAVARGAELLAETTVTRVHHDDQGATLLLRRSDGEQHLRARAVLMAGGRRSTPKLPPAAPTRPREELFVGLKSHVTGLTMPDRVELFLFAGGYVGVNPVETGAANVCLLVSYAQFARAGRTLPAMFAAIAAQNAAFAHRMQEAHLLAETFCTVAAVDTHRPAAPWVEMACLGDTATMIPPLCGDGMAMALRSAELCAPLAHDYLRGACSLSAWRDRYCECWQAEFTGRLRLGRALQSLLNHPPLADALVASGRFVPRLADYVVRMTRGDQQAAPAQPDGNSTQRARIR